MEGATNLLNETGWHYAPSWWFRNVGILSSGAFNNGVLFVEYENENFYLMLLNKRLLRKRLRVNTKNAFTVCCLFKTQDFKTVEFQQMEITDKLPYSIKEGKTLLENTKIATLNLEEEFDYFKIIHYMDLHPDLRRSWVMLFRDLVELSPEEIQKKTGLQSLRVNSNEVVFYEHSDKSSGCVTEYIQQVERKVRARQNLKKIRDNVNVRRIVTYWDQQAVDKNFERHLEEDKATYNKMQKTLPLTRAEIAVRLIKFMT